MNVRAWYTKNICPVCKENENAIQHNYFFT
jgi:hypothetical protein